MTGSGAGCGFVGRARELAVLAEAVQQPPAVVLVEGEAGAGKSRLLAQAFGMPSAHGSEVGPAGRETVPAGRAGGVPPVLIGRCHPLRDPLPYGPVVDALRDAGGLLPPVERVPRAAGALVRLLPDLADRLPSWPAAVGSAADAEGAEAAAGGPEAERRRLVQGFRALLAALGRVVLVVEDVQWADAASRELLLLLARDLPDGLVLVLTYRAEDLPVAGQPLGAAYRRPPGVGGALIRLGPLSEPETAELTREALGPAATAATARAVHERSGGLPMVAVEDLGLLGELLGGGGERDPAAVAEAATRPGGGPGSVPGSGPSAGSGAPPAEAGEPLAAALLRAEAPRGLRDAVVERFAALSAEAAAVADAAAVLAEPAAEELFGEVSGLGPEAVAAGLTEALRVHLLVEGPAARYGYRQGLAGQVVYRRIPGPRRTALHRRVIAVLERLDPPPLAVIARHTLATGDQRRWQELAEAAAEQAVAVGDLDSADGLLRRLLAEPGLDEDQRGRTALALSRIAANGVDYGVSADALTRILADPQLPTADRGEIRLTLGILMAGQSGDRSGYRQIEQAVAELTERPARAARAMVALAMNERDGAGEDAWPWLERAGQTLATGPDEAVGAALRATVLTFRAREADPGVWPALELLPRSSDNPEVVRQTTRALYNVGDIAVELGHDRRAQGLLEESRRLARLTGIPYLECYSRIALLRLDGLAGRWDRLEERFDALGAEFPDLAMAGAERTLLLGRLAAARGRLARAQELFTAAAQYGEREAQVTTALRAAAGLASLRLAEGDHARAAELLAPAMAELRRARAWARAADLLPTAVGTWLAGGDRPAAEQLVADAARVLTGPRAEPSQDGAEALEGAGGRVGGAVDAPAAVAALAVARGLLVRGERPGEAVGCFAEARDRWREIGRPYEATRAEEQLARALAEGDPADATARLAGAVDSYTALGAASDAARCQHALRDLGLGRPGSPGRRGYGEDLSPRERQVAELVAQGASNQDAAQALFLSQRTVEHHVAGALRKLGVTRRELAEALRARYPEFGSGVG